MYCYVQDVLRHGSYKEAWGSYVCVKEGILERLRSEVRKLPHGVVGVSTVTDPYQPAEKGLELTRHSLAIIGHAGFKASIQTKSSLASRDLDLMKAYGFELGVTVTSSDKSFQRRFEPGASPPEERAQLLEEASSMGIRTWIFYGPIIPGQNDSEDQMTFVASLARRTNSAILFDRLNLKPILTVRLRGTLIQEELDLIQESDYDQIYNRLEMACLRLGVKAKRAF